MSALLRVVRVAGLELHVAMRSRRALVVALLFISVTGAAMYGTVSAFAAMEREVSAALGLPVPDAAGTVTMTLWRSKPFMHIVSHLVGNQLVFADLTGQHPVVLAYAVFLLFHLVPFLTLLVSAPRIAEDLRSGAARYLLVRTTRMEWTLGVFFGEALLLAVALLLGALAAWGVALWQMAGMSAAALLPSLLDWSVRAWIYAFGWLGLFLGVSHFSRSGGKATALCILVLLGAVAWPRMLANFADSFAGLVHLDLLAPSASKTLLWRRTPSAFLQGCVQLAALSFLFLSLGAAVFRRRDV